VAGKINKLGWILSSLNVALIFVNLGLWLIAWCQGLIWRADFTMLYTGGAILHDGLGARLYDLDLQAQYQQQILEGSSFVDGVLPFNYPSYVALLIAPLTLFPLTQAFGFWTLLQAGLLVWLLRRLWHLSADWDPLERRALLIAVLAFTPLLNTILLGSFSLLLLVSWVEGYVQLKSLREGYAGLCLTLGALKPQSVLAFGVALLGARRWRSLALMAMVGCLVFIGTTLALGLHIWRDFFMLLLEIGKVFDAMGIVLPDMHNFRGMLAGFLGPMHLPLINTLSISVFIGTVLWILWAWRGSWNLQSAVFPLRLAVTCALGLFFSLHLYPQDSLLWVFPAFLGYVYVRGMPRLRHYYGLFLLNWPWFFLLDQFAPLRIAGIRPAVFLFIVLLFWLGILLRRCMIANSESAHSL
jgi:hypothetical protein